MKSIVLSFLLIASGLGSLPAAQPLQYRLEFSFEGMNQKWLADLSKETRSQVEIKNGVMPFFYAVVKPDQHASLQLLTEVTKHTAITDEEKILCGVLIDFKPVAKDGAIVLSGTSRLRRSIPKDGSQSST